MEPNSLPDPGSRNAGNGDFRDALFAIPGLIHVLLSLFILFLVLGIIFKFLSIIIFLFVIISVISLIVAFFAALYYIRQPAPPPAPGSFSLDMVDGGDKYTEKDEQRNDRRDETLK